MATVSITIRLDEHLKNQVERMFNEMGMNMTTAFTIFAKTVVRQGKIPFEISVDPFFSEANQTYLMRSVEQLRAGKGTYHELIEVDDA